jgi:hypothetical protein
MLKRHHSKRGHTVKVFIMETVESILFTFKRLVWLICMNVTQKLFNWMEFFR